jgi:hypothetical protein
MTDMLDAQGAVYADLAEVFLLAGKPDEAAASLEQAIERYSSASASSPRNRWISASW